MNPSRIFIERPVMTTLVMAAFIIFGIFGYLTLPVSDLPNFDFPTIQVNANVPGADPETMASGVAAPLENAFSTINGIDSMTSSSRQGQTNVSIQFSLDRNIDAAAQDVQAAISGALRQLPRNMPVPPHHKVPKILARNQALPAKMSIGEGNHFAVGNAKPPGISCRWRGVISRKN